MLPQADKVITIIEEARERIAGLGIDPEKICIVSNTINFENLSVKNKKKETESFILFYGGAINIHRGLQMVLKAIKINADKNIDINLWIVGDGSYRKSLEELDHLLSILNRMSGSLATNPLMRCLK